MRNRILLVTGASSCLGDGLIRSAADQFDTIFAHFNHGRERVHALQQTFPEREIVPLQADFSDADSVQGMIATILDSGKVPTHMVLIGAERTRWNKFSKFQWEDYNREIEVSLRSAVLLTQAFVPRMTKAKFGRLLFVLSAFLCNADPKYMSPYITTKYALYGLMKNLAAEYADKGMRVNAISPDMMDTPFIEQVPDLVKQMAAEQNASGKLLSPERVVPYMLELLSDQEDVPNGENRYISGS